MGVTGLDNYVAMLIRKSGKKEIGRLHEQVLNGDCDMSFYEFEDYVENSNILELDGDGYVNVK